MLGVCIKRGRNVNLRRNLMRRESGGDRAVLIIDRRNATDFGQQLALLSDM